MTSKPFERPPLQVLIADDHGVVRKGVRALIEQQPGWVVVGEAATGREAAELARTLSPQVIVMDIAMPDLNGIEATRRIRSEQPGVHVLVLTMHETDAFVQQALDAGASGILLKADSSELLVPAINAVLDGRPYFSPSIARLIMAGFLRNTVEAPTATPALSTRQREILQLIAEGRSTKDVARLLGVSIKTAETHRTQLMKKIGARSVAEVVRYAVRNGVVTA